MSLKLAKAVVARHVARQVPRPGRLLILALFLFNALYFAFYRLVDTEVPSFSVNFSNEKSVLESLGFNSNHSAEFKQAVKTKFRRVEKDKERFWLANTELTEVDIKVPVQKFLKAYEGEDSWANVNEFYYDPRFTLSMYLNQIRTEYLKFKPAQKRQLDSNTFLNPIKLPFNWADWMDVTVLNPELAKPLDERINCEYLLENTNNNPDPSYFCIDNQDFSEEKIKALGFKHREQLPGVIIHAHSSHDDRTYSDVRVFEARAFALTHLPKPYRVIVLNGGEDGGTFEFDVDTESNQRLVSSPFIDNYLSSNGIDIRQVTNETILTLNHLTEFQKLKQSIIPKHLPLSDGGYRMYESIKKQDPTASRELTIPAELFSYSQSIIDQQLEFYKGRPAGSLSRHHQLYYDSLVDCAQHTDTNEPTYFKMATIRRDDERNRDREWGWHYDWRFFDGALNYKREGWTRDDLNHRTNIILDRLLRNWNRFAEEKGIITWIMHGPLLSWYWDGLMFPFDVDIDIQMPVVELARLAREYNQTLVVEDPTEGYGKFLIDVGTYIHNRGISTKGNHIDARFVDVDSGIYIDITAVSKSAAVLPSEYEKKFSLAQIEKKPEGKEAEVEVYNDRRKHFYKLDQLSPLKYSMMGGVPVYIPATIHDRLVFEYSRGLTKYEFGGWFFIKMLNLWVKLENLVHIFENEDIYDAELQYDKRKILRLVLKMTEEDVIKLLDVDEVLVEYYLTKDLTDLHKFEMEFLFDAEGKDSTTLKDDEERRKIYNELTSTFKITKKPLRKSLYDFSIIERLKHTPTYNPPAVPNLQG